MKKISVSKVSYTFLSSNPEWMKIGKVFSPIEYWEQTCIVPATVITLNPINPSAFRTTNGDASAIYLNETWYHKEKEKNKFLFCSRGGLYHCHHSCWLCEIFPENYTLNFIIAFYVNYNLVSWDI